METKDAKVRLENKTNANENKIYKNQNTFSNNAMQWKPKIQNVDYITLHLVLDLQLVNMNVLQQISKQE